MNERVQMKLQRDEALTMDEAAIALNVTRKTVQNYVADGWITRYNIAPGAKLGKWRISAAVIRHRIGMPDPETKEPDTEEKVAV